MIKSTASKVMWVGRATVFLVGLSVILALMFGVASAAFAGNLDPLKLGTAKNVATRITTLVGKVATGSAFMVKNPSGGSALTLSVGDPAADPATKSVAPMKVNSQQLVSNLNSDELDGKSSSAFATAYKRTVVVSPVGTDTENGTALLDALSGITDASASKPYLLYIEPATYDLGNGSLWMKSYVDIEGSGELNTVITSNVAASICFNHPGTVTAADNGNFEMRFLTVRNTGADYCASAISNISAYPQLTHLTAESTGVATEQHAVFNNNSSPTMTDVTATASGGGSSYGVWNNDYSYPTMTEVTATASGGNSSYGVWNGRTSGASIRQSELRGTTNSLWQQGLTDPSTVALTQLFGPVQGPGGSVVCFNNYDQTLDAVTCP